MAHLRHICHPFSLGNEESLKVFEQAGYGQSCPELDQSTVQTGSEEEAVLV